MTTRTVPSRVNPDGSSPEPGRTDRSKTLVLIVACLAQFMVVLDVVVVNVAIPDMTGTLSLSRSGQQWVIDAYTLTFGGLLLLGGRLSDLVGQRRMFLSGVALFTTFSLLCGLSMNQAMIEWFRAGQGVGGAILAPTSLSLLTVAYTEQHERQRAIGIWATVQASGAAAGVVIGGLLTSALDWRWVFFINIPVGLVVLIVTATGVRVPRLTQNVRLDIPGALLITSSIGLILYAVIGVQERGWSSSVTLCLLLAGVAAAAVFLIVQARFARDPLMPLSLFRSRERSSANVLFLIVGAVIFFLYFDISVHLQRVDGDSPIKAGVSFLPVAVATTTAALNGRRVLALVGARVQLVIGLLMGAGGLVWLSWIGVHGEYWTHVALPMILTGLGLGTTFVPATIAATSGVPADQAGIASGLVNTSRQVGGAVGLASLATVAASGLGSDPSLSAIAHGDQVALIAAAALAALGALVAPLIGPLGRQTRQ